MSIHPCSCQTLLLVYEEKVFHWPSLCTKAGHDGRSEDPPNERISVTAAVLFMMVGVRRRGEVARRSFPFIQTCFLTRQGQNKQPPQSVYQCMARSDCTNRDSFTLSHSSRKIRRPLSVLRLGGGSRLLRLGTTLLGLAVSSRNPSYTADAMPTTAVSKLAFRPVTADDVATCAAMEAASYPADEAASPQGLRYRQAEAGAYFRCAIDKASDEIVGFVCGTRCTSFTHESMATHHPQGRLLAIHSVVVREDCRRQGLARQMLQDYLAHIEAAQAAAEAAAAVVPSSKSVVPPPLEKVVLLAKSHLLGFYVQCGLTVTRPSPIVHGQELYVQYAK
jgi:ribosomal protein S18 acetylase RimI-like enzyme